MMNQVPAAKNQVDVCDLFYRYPCKGWLFRRSENKPVLKNISFTLSGGDVVGLVGESGSGKTTLGKCLNGLLTPSARKLEVSGHDLLNLRGGRSRRDLRSKAQLIFQESEESFDPLWKIGKSLLEPLRIHRPRERDLWSSKIQKLLPHFGISSELLDRIPCQVSGGELQRLAVIRALLLDPKIIIADEPFSALDIITRRNILAALLKQCLSTYTTLLLISHDVNVAKSICRRIIVLLRGNIVEIGPSNKIGNSDSHPYTLHLLGSAPRWRTPLPPINYAEALGEEFLCPFFSDCRQAQKKCHNAEIPSIEVSPGHKVACYLRK